MHSAARIATNGSPVAQPGVNRAAARRPNAPNRPNGRCSEAIGSGGSTSAPIAKQRSSGPVVAAVQPKPPDEPRQPITTHAAAMTRARSRLRPAWFSAGAAIRAAAYSRRASV